MCSKFDISITIKFWDMIIKENDQSMIFFFSVALMMNNRKVIYEAYSVLENT